LESKAAVPTAFMASVLRRQSQTGPQPVPAYTTEANGRVERLNRTLVERVRALLHQFNLPTNMWQYAWRVAAYTRNMVPSEDMDVTPSELFE
jgi:hypothetical protein